MLIIVFFVFFGCAYEFTKCYIEKKYQNQIEEEENSQYEYNMENSNNNNRNDENHSTENNNQNLTNCDKFFIVLIIILGILCQPIYLMVYLLYALMECYRRFNCWFYYID